MLVHLFETPEDQGRVFISIGEETVRTNSSLSVSSKPVIGLVVWWVVWG